jgi:hypothetical protein
MTPLAGQVCTLVVSLVVLDAALPRQALPAASADRARSASPAVATGLDSPRAEALPGAGLRVVREHRYRMAGRIRPLLFWFGRDNVGLGRVSWLEGPEGARGYQLLVGTDPARAPRRLNRWGFVSEATVGATGAVLALMTRSDETSMEQADAATVRGEARGDFRAIRARLASGTATWRLSTVATPEPLTVHDLDDAVAWVNRTPPLPPRERRVAADLHPGLLTSVATLVQLTVDETARTGGAEGVVGRHVGYAFGQRTYELRLRSAGLAAGRAGGRSVRALKTVFEMREPGAGGVSTFELTYGVDGAWAGVPLVIEWQPRWWLKVTLQLDESAEATRSASR